MSDIIEGAEELLDDSVEAADDAVESSADQVGLTSEESGDEKKSLLSDLTVYDAMLIVSFGCIALATLLLLIELRTFGDFPGSFPWRTTES